MLEWDILMTQLPWGKPDKLVDSPNWTLVSRRPVWSDGRLCLLILSGTRAPSKAYEDFCS